METKGAHSKCRHVWWDIPLADRYEVLLAASEIVFNDGSAVVWDGATWKLREGDTLNRTQAAAFVRRRMQTGMLGTDI